MASFKTLADVTSGDDPRRPPNLSTYAGGERSGLAVDLPPPSEPNRLVLYSDGFVIADQFRPFSEPANKQLWETIQTGQVPSELRNQVEATKEGEVLLSIVDKSKGCYKDRRKSGPHSGGHAAEARPSPPPAFKSPGCKVAESTSASPAVVSVDPTRSTVTVNPNQPRVRLAFRFSNGTRLNQEFNESHTTQDIYNYVHQVAPSSRPYQLVVGFPPKSITGKSLKELDNELITQRPTP